MGAIKLREIPQVNDEDDEDTAANYQDTTKDGVIDEKTHKNILKVEQRETNESIISKIKLPPDVVPKGSSQPKVQAANSSKEALTKIPKFSYVELSEFWQNHKNSLSKEQKDMPPICYENKTLFDMISYTANMPQSSDARQWTETLNEYKSGLRHQKKFGYQYGLGTFPIMFR